MSIKMKEKLKDFKGKVIVHTEPTGEKNSDGSPVMETTDMRLGDALLFALMAPPKVDTPMAKVDRFKMAVKISAVIEDVEAKSDMELTVAEIRTCIDAAGEHLTTMFLGRILELMDPAQLK